MTEARPLIVNRRVDRVAQLGRDEVLLTLRGKMGLNSLFISAQSVHGRMCLVAPGQTAKQNSGSTGGAGGGQAQTRDPRAPYDPLTDRYISKYGNNTAVPNFCLLLRKHLTGATLIAADQPVGERIVDLVFSCTDEVGSTSIKILTAEIMGRHSNLVFWDKETSKVICASHNVTKDMSRQREIASGLRYERPPSQDRPSLYTVEEATFLKLFDEFINRESDEQTPAATLEQWLIATFTGAGRYLCEEIVAAAGLPSEAKAARTVSGAGAKLAAKILQMRSTDAYKPFMLKDLSRYSIMGWLAVPASSTVETSAAKTFPSVNDLIEEYFRTCEIAEQCNQLRERLRAELTQELAKIDARVKMASAHVQGDEQIGNTKKWGDLILAHLTSIAPGQEVLEVEDIFSAQTDEIGSDDSGGAGGAASGEAGTAAAAHTVKIKLNPNLTSAQNAQAYYRQYAKNRARHGAASQSVEEAMTRRSTLEKQLHQLASATDLIALRTLKDNVSGKKPHEIVKPKTKTKKGGDSKILSVNSSDGWTIYVGRNRNENDYLLSRLAQPNDLWFHVLGQGGAHVLIRIPSSKQEPPQTTISEAAQIAARLSKATHGSKVRVVYTQCKFVRKLAKDKPGLVKYEMERTVEVDTAKPMSKAMKQLFSPEH
ncbi:MAG: NFACT family protein [Cyanobacteria bacterium REEB67]|nr:NFACT family protein [Cyanobacteria bacterium REEB67]